MPVIDPNTAAGGAVDILDPELLRDPVSGYSRIREQAPLAWADVPGLGPMHLATRYADVRLVLNDPRFVMAVPPSPDGGPDPMELQLRARGVPPECLPYLRAGLTDTDGADHARLRALVSRGFTARRVAALRPRVEEITEELLDRLVETARDSEDGVVDLLTHFAYPLPIIVICELVGIPAADRSRWRRWSELLVTGSGPEFGAALLEMIDWTRALIALRRDAPEDDLISALIHAQDADGDRLSDVEMVSLILSLIIAGHETTAHLIANGTAALLTHPEQYALLRSDPTIAPRAVHELLRWCGPALAARMRYATEDLKLAGTVVRRGEAVMPMLVGANHDPRMFPGADRLDITRTAERGRRETHLAFAHGPHYCLGAALARQEGEVAFVALAGRFPALALAVDPAELERPMAPGALRLTALPVTL
ncbi:hypothetical protein FHR81_004437 [Actinoalloteichus hoggarensis]|uniref:Cytochrome P450 107B1 n=1 Tax=Actinoalloteichus hoggarensis TaxID=1470176 RepID=A0A221W3E1_9PSEU|nr:cytochrome P450 [Actinoalloteichus hoggarensis]ASO20328.1 Cytochrome P450 107B1 [Actinoalloteichus hoggarensis]MBB5923366.1 hypothetical protein [Actinoalloteichus hoggarensis]